MEIASWEIRQFVGAHRDDDAGAQLDILDVPQPLEVYRLAGNFYVPLTALADFQIRLTLVVGNFEVLLTQHLKESPSPNHFVSDITADSRARGHRSVSAIGLGSSIYLIHFIRRQFATLAWLQFS